MNDIRNQLDSMKIENILSVLKKVLDDHDYQEDSYTDLMHDILIEYEHEWEISRRQLEIIKNHLMFNSDLWY